MANTGKGKDQITYLDYIVQNRKSTDKARDIVKKYGQIPARNFTDLKGKLGYVVSEFKTPALDDIISIHPDKDIIIDWYKRQQPSKFTGDQSDPNYMYSDMKGKKPCNCKDHASEHMNFNTNYRADNLFADGSTDASSSSAPTVVVKHDWKTTAWVVGIVVLAGLLISSGEKQRSY